jgi:hypothetical protein
MLKTLRQIASIGIITEPRAAPDESLRLRESLQEEIRAVLGRALCIRQVDAGSCNGCELEITALNNPLYNLEGLGIRFVASPRVPENGTMGIGFIEGWRGPVWVALEAGPAGSIRRCHPHDPSWQNWPVLEHAIIGNIVPDFPLINKSFNLSYSGHDL